MELRRATLSDELLIADWLQNDTDCFYATGEDVYSAEMYRSWYEASDQFGYILLKEDQPVAYGEIWEDVEERDLELAHLIVHPSYRNKGIGKQLVRMLQKECLAFPYPWIYLRIEPENSRAQKCYAGAGFIEDVSLRTSCNSQWIWMKARNGEA
ncbi:GNAT family N-acetyltransferase [Paenisporosarcina sp. NPDC076898]|uniref:GNAT family N-acetyltransferase n=1 Tax=unclassified Paenisporosarcina TaxID=2642018 RepID=UPI003D0497EE